MSPTIFSAADAKQESRQRELEEELEKIKQENGANRNSLPYREPAHQSAELEKKQVRHPEELSTDKTGSPEKTHATESTDKTDKSAEPDKNETPNMPNLDQTPASEIVSPQPNQEAPQPAGEKLIERQPEDYSEVMRREKPTTNPLAAFVVRPPGAVFVNQHAREKILLVLRQHPIVNVGWMLITFALVLAPFLVFPLLPLFDFLGAEFKFFAMIGWYLLVSAYVIEHFLYWYYNIYIITDERIIDIDFISLIYRQVSEAKIDKIEDVTAATSGLFAGIFNYGNVTIQTAAEKREFEFQRVPQPATVTKFLNELMLEEENEKIEGRVM